MQETVLQIKTKDLCNHQRLEILHQIIREIQIHHNSQDDQINQRNQVSQVDQIDQISLNDQENKGNSRINQE